MRILIAILTVLWAEFSFAQSTVTYTVDPDFNTQETLRSKTSVFDIHPLEDGGFFLGGGFDMFFTNPGSPFVKGIAMVTASGDVHPDWEDGQTVFCRELHVHQDGFIYPTGEFLSKVLFNGDSWYFTFGDIWGDYFKVQPWGIGNNPYEVRWTWDIFILEDQSVLIGGAIATDTLQPGLFRHLMRLLPDGSHDDTFPIIEAMPQGLNTHISKIERASDGSWYVSGRFQGINGHISPHIAHLTPDFEVDTDFVSPFYYESVSSGLHTEMKLLDSQDRLWFSGNRVRLAEDSDNFLHLVRLLPDGSVDPNFTTGRVETDYPFGWFVPPVLVSVIIEPDLDDDIFFIGGVFSHYNDTLQPSISALDDNGHILDNFFGNQGCTVNSYDPDDPSDLDAPAVRALEHLVDGSLMVGGSFSDFMGVERYSMVKLNPGTLSSGDLPKPDSAIKVYPNPASSSIAIQLTKEWSQSITSIQFIDLSGRTVASYAWGNGVFDVSALANGLYLVQVLQDGKAVSSEKFIVQH